jgi:predicted Zn finger-like uncharacterized protein
MSLATRCTHCGTIFKVVQDQLKVSEGWVRCGRCNEVFHALPTLFDLDKDSPPPRVTPPSPADDPAGAPTDTLTHEAPGLPDAATLLDAPPADWEHTQPGNWPAKALQPEPEPEPVIEPGDFELDTAVGYEQLARPAELEPTLDTPSLPLQLERAPQPWNDAPLPDGNELPQTDEGDALDSRYLLPTSRERKAAYLRTNGPEFADAQFPSDALMEEWEEDLLPPLSDATDAALAGEHTHSEALASDAAAAEHAQAAQAALASLRALAASTQAEQAQQDRTAAPSIPPSRFDDNFIPETAVEPPSQRRGKTGTRGGHAEPATPEFMRRAQRQAFWRHPIIQSVMLLSVLLLTLGLALQMAHQFRDVLAAYHPPLRPYLAQWCAMVACELKPPLRLDGLQVESATLVRATSDGADRYRLAVVVHNKAAIDLAWPHVDLTLTDTNGAVIARRAFDPREAQWLDTADAKADAPQRPVPAARTPVAVPHDRSTTLMWSLRAAGIQPAGYTAELFYP